MFRPEDMDAFNADVSSWTKETRQHLVKEMNSQGISHRPGSRSPQPAQRSLRTAQRKYAGVTTRVSFKMPRHMVFVHKGVGRGTGIVDVGSTNRTPKPWFNPVIENRMESLLDMVADHHGAMVLNAIMIR